MMVLLALRKRIALTLRDPLLHILLAHGRMSGWKSKGP